MNIAAAERDLAFRPSAGIAGRRPMTYTHVRYMLIKWTNPPSIAAVPYVCFMTFDATPMTALPAALMSVLFTPESRCGGSPWYTPECTGSVAGLIREAHAPERYGLLKLIAIGGYAGPVRLDLTASHLLTDDDLVAVQELALIARSRYLHLEIAGSRLVGSLLMAAGLTLHEAASEAG